MKTFYRSLSCVALVALIVYVPVTTAALLGLASTSNGNSNFGLVLLTLPWSIFGMHRDPVDAHSPVLALFIIPAVINAGILFVVFRLLRQKSN